MQKRWLSLFLACEMLYYFDGRPAGVDTLQTCQANRHQLSYVRYAGVMELVNCLYVRVY